MIYYNQNNYSNYPYPSSSNPNATIKSGGCGVVCAAMIVSNMTSVKLTPPEAAQLAIDGGARVSGGTDMHKMSKIICNKYGLRYSTSSKETDLQAHLKSGGMAIANVGGDRRGWTGVFSDSGHYIVVASYNTSTKKVTVLDPGYYSGKFNKEGRKGKVTVDGNYCYTTLDVLNYDTYNRTPNYYLYSVDKEMEVDEDMTQEQFNKMMDNYLAERAKMSPQEWSWTARQWAESNGIIKGDENGDKQYGSWCTREQMVQFLYRVSMIFKDMIK